MARKRRTRSDPRRSWGSVRRTGAGNYQATYLGPDGVRHKAPSTFVAELDAGAWLDAERRLIDGGSWSPPSARRDRAARVRRLTFGEYARTWLDAREIRPTTRKTYEASLNRQILAVVSRVPARGRRPAFDEVLPGLEDVPMSELTRDVVESWYRSLDKSRSRTRSKAYSLLRTICNSAVDEECLADNPCKIRGAGLPSPKLNVDPASPAELVDIAANVPPRWRLLVLLAGWCALRFGEATELRRKDIDVDNGVLKIRRGVTWVDGEAIVGDPKTEAGKREVAIPPHLVPIIKQHLEDWVEEGPESLLFTSARTGKHLPENSFYDHYDKARKAADRPDLRFHDLRHTGAVMAAQAGATMAELMGRLGHTTPAAALRYQHSAKGRDRHLAKRLSDMAGDAE